MTNKEYIEEHLKQLKKDFDIAIKNNLKEYANKLVEDIKQSEAILKDLEILEKTLIDCRKDFAIFLNELKTGKNELGGNINKIILHDYNIILKKHIEVFTGKISWIVEEYKGEE